MLLHAPADTGPSVTDIIGASVAVIALIVGWFQLRIAVRDRRARDRPYVSLTGDLSGNRMRFVVQNHGQTLARNVLVQFREPLSNHNGGVLLDTGAWRIGDMAPGQRVLMAFDFMSLRFQSQSSLEFVAEVTYGWDENRAWNRVKEREAVESATVDFDPLARGFQQQGVEDEALAATEKIAQSANKIARAVEALANRRD